MLEIFKREDFLPGMIAVLRSGTEVKSGFLFSFDYSDDLRFTGAFPEGWGEKTADAADVMQVRLPSGTVLWERKEEPVFVTCIGCALEPLDKDTGTCMICLRGGHQSDIDFYRPAEGGASDGSGK